MQSMDRRTCRKRPGIYCKCSSVHVLTIWIIIYFCKLLGCSLVYSCILICVTFLRFFLWLSVKLHRGYMPFHALTERSLYLSQGKKKLRCTSTMVYAVCWQLLLFMFNLKIKVCQLFSWTEHCTGYFSACVPDDWPGHWTTEVINITTAIL